MKIVDHDRRACSRSSRPSSRVASTRSAVQALSGVQLAPRPTTRRAARHRHGGRPARPARGRGRARGHRRPARAPAARRRPPAARRPRHARAAPRRAGRRGRLRPARFHLRTLRAEDFPPLPRARGGDGPRRDVPAAAFVETIAKVARSASRDETRPILTGILVSASGTELRMVATDSYRLSVKETTLETPLEGGFEANVPARALQELARGRASRRGRRDDPHRRARRTRSSSRPAASCSRRGSSTVSSRTTASCCPETLRARAARARRRAHRRRAAHQPDGAEERAAAAVASREGELTVSAQTPDVGEASEPLPVPFAGEPFEIGFNPDFLRDGLESVESGDVVLKLISPLRPGPDRGRRRQRVPLPDHAHPPERLRPRCRCAPPPARLPHLRRGGRRRSARGLTVVHGRNGAGKTNLLEALYFGCTGRSCRTSNEREVVRFGRRGDAGRGRRARPRRRRTSSRVGFQPGEPKRMRVDGAPVERLLDAPGRPLVSVFLPDRLELVKGAARAAPLRTSTRSSPRCGRRARRPAAPTGRRSRSATRCSARVRVRPQPRRASLPTWDLELARHGARAARRPRPRGRRCSRERFAALAEELGLAGAARAALPAADAGRRRRGASPPSWPSAWTPTSSAASPATARTATTSRSCATGASCASTGRRASSAWRCWRCCWPSATRSPTSAGRRRCCCSTTS